MNKGGGEGGEAAHSGLAGAETEGRERGRERAWKWVDDTREGMLFSS